MFKQLEIQRCDFRRRYRDNDLEIDVRDRIMVLQRETGGTKVKRRNYGPWFEVLTQFNVSSSSGR